MDDPAAIFCHLTSMSSKQYKKTLLLQLLNAAKSCIPSIWQSSSLPTVSQWFARVIAIQDMEDLTAALRDKTSEMKEKFLWATKKPCISIQQFTHAQIIDWTGHAENKDWVALENNIGSIPVTFSQWIPWESCPRQ